MYKFGTKQKHVLKTLEPGRIMTQINFKRQRVKNVFNEEKINIERTKLIREKMDGIIKLTTK